MNQPLPLALTLAFCFLLSCVVRLLLATQGIRCISDLDDNFSGKERRLVSAFQISLIKMKTLITNLAYLTVRILLQH